MLEAFKKMSKHTSIPLADLVVIALKRFRASHNDYEGTTLPLQDDDH